MSTYIGFLRAINLGATRKFSKVAIVEAAEGAGFAEVATYINTGNVRFETALRPRERIESKLEAAFEAVAGFEVPTVVFTQRELREIAERASGLDHDGKHYVSLLKQTPTAAAVGGFEEAAKAAAGPGEGAWVSGRGVHLLMASDYRTSKLTNAIVERHLGVATNRNLTVIRSVVEKWC